MNGRVLLLLAAAAAAAALAVTAAAAATATTVGVAAAVVHTRKAGRQGGGGTRKKKRKYTPRVRKERPLPFDLDRFEALLIHLNVGFESYFRLPRPLFDGVLADIQHSLLRAAPHQGVNSNGHSMTPEHRLAVALRFFAGAQWQDVVVAMQPICKAEVYTSVWLVVDAINNEYAGKWDYPRPGKDAGPGEMAEATEFYSMLEARFRAKSPANCMVGVIGAIDGCILRVANPGVGVENPGDHWCERKKTFGMLLMAAADADMVIRNWSVAYTPKCHDSTAWAGSELGAWVNAGGLPWPFCFLGDNAFRPGCAGLLSPGTAHTTTDAYKYVQSRGRMPAEQCFGILIRVWGILWRDLAVPHVKRAALVSALMHLHNVRRSAGAALDVEGGHQVRMFNGQKQWGLTERRKVDGNVETTTVWTAAPKIDAEGRPTELLGGLKAAFQSDTVKLDGPRSSGATDGLKARTQMLEDDIATHGVQRPAASLRRQRNRGGDAGSL